MNKLQTMRESEFKEIKKLALKNDDESKKLIETFVEASLEINKQ